jgi:hypothetical protein
VRRFEAKRIEVRGSGSLSLTNSTGDAHRDRGVWRSIPSIRRRLEQEEERGSTEDNWGLL